MKKSFGNDIMGLRTMRKFIYKAIALIILSVFFLTASNLEGEEGMKMAQFHITSPVISGDGSIPSRYTCDGKDVNPPLKFENVPPGTKSLALIVDDPDAPVGIWVHWVIWNIDPSTGEVRENSVPANAVQGINDFKKHGYGGPCPPSGTHRYYFKAYALNSNLSLDRNADKAGLEKAMKGKIIAESRLMGTYKRK